MILSKLVVIKNIAALFRWSSYCVFQLRDIWSILIPSVPIQYKMKIQVAVQIFVTYCPADRLYRTYLHVLYVLLTGSYPEHASNIVHRTLNN